MKLDSFKQSINMGEMPAGLSIYLQALWYDAAGNWKKAHSMVDDLDDPIACWVHAYLHRKEPDIWNADYWYRKAAKQRPDISLKQEWDNLVTALL